jgi:transposase
MEKVHVVSLTPRQRQHLLKVVGVGRNRASVIRRAHILLKSDEGKTDKEIAELLYINEETVRRTRQRFCQTELKDALQDKPRPAKEKRLSGKAEGYLIALSCSDPPEGAACWTMELLAQQLVKDGIVPSISAETVRLALKKTASSRGR